MAAWRRTGRIEKHRGRLIDRMRVKGIPIEFAERVFEQIRGFGEYGFPESHAASFALISYATSWLKCHYPAEFACSLLNAQPMGFYSPATIVEEAKRHGVEVRAIDVRVSDSECTLEAASTSTSTSTRPFALRMGLRYVKGMSAGDRQRVEEVRAQAPFSSIADFAVRTGLDEGTLSRLAEAGAFEGFGVDRRAALWELRGVARTRADSLRTDDVGETPELPALAPLDTILWDYRTSQHSPRGHPLEPLRAELRAQRLPDAAVVGAMRHGRRVRYAGIVICRQQPGTASGVTFMTLEDETGFVNVVVWRQIFDKYLSLIKTASFLGITGRLQVEHDVVHIIADQLWRPTVRTAPPQAASRDFH
jgi:error-prone DNA polymerase